MINIVDAVKAVDLILNDGNLTGDSKTAEVFYSQGSMVKLINKFIITPNIIVSESLKGSEAVKDVIEHNVSLFTSMYVQVFTTLVSLHDMTPEVAFELLSSSYETAFTRTVGTEEFTMDNIIAGLENDFSFLPGLEADNKKNESSKTKKKSGNSTSINAKTDSGNISNLITREIAIEINVGERKIIIPALVRANVIYTKFSNIENMLGKEDNHSVLDRIDDYRAGAISISDLIFANDLIKDYKKRRIQDKDDLIREMRLRELNSASKYVKHGVSGYGKLYQMIIMSSLDASKIEKKLRGSLHKERVKESFLDATSSLTCTVIDPDYERIIMYINDLKGSIDLSFKEIGGKKDKSENMEELLKILMATRTI